MSRRDEAWWLIHQLRKLRWYICIECDADGCWHVQLGADCRAQSTDLAEAVLQTCHMALSQQEIIERDLHRLVERWRREDARRNSAKPTRCSDCIGGYTCEAINGACLADQPRGSA